MFFPLPGPIHLFAEDTGMFSKRRFFSQNPTSAISAVESDHSIHRLQRPFTTGKIKSVINDIFSFRLTRKLEKFISMATAAASTKETTNYARLCRMLVDVGTQALRDKFNGIHLPANLQAVLAANKPMLQTLRARKIINPTQWGKLFPAIPNSVSAASFDTTLLMVLLRNLCGLAAPASGWDALPPSTDISPEADIARVKYYRNTVYAHAECASVDDTTFNKYWSEIRDTLVRLGGVVYKAAVDNLETDCMDPGMEEHYKELLCQWKNDEDNIKDDLKKIGIDVEKIIEKIDDLAKSTVSSKKETRAEGELCYIVM